MLTKDERTACKFDSVGDFETRELDNYHSRRHLVMMKYLEEVLGVKYVKDLSLYSCPATNGSGVLSLTWAEWIARGWEVAKWDMRYNSSSTRWPPRLRSNRFKVH